ncbi:PREDICTED: UPF0481 protein At3g47200-like [Fragaria vesca subsp. vesca]|uniref:UPF0481 protein At3g47200-like n=1 Tax=Fragaria vesca subsp. vesca TaxID=101020 RepID=UPI0002C2F88B|nr:PREDICTED: UPF0481 protein At3g47200-like [Fragaria vesca subsp. vesca]
MGGSDVAASTCDIETPSQTRTEKLGSVSAPSPLRCILSPPSRFRCIHQVPDRFRCEREKDYTPRVISIGPYHHGNKSLKRMEVHKKRYLDCFMERSHSKQNDYIEKIRGQEEELRKCYTETIELTRDEFVTMVLVDAIFLIEFLLRYPHGDSEDKNDYIFEIPMMLPDVQTDLLMLENQLPLFILEDLFSLYNPESDGGAKRLSIEFLLYQAGGSFGVKLGGKIHGETSIPNLFAIRFDDKWILKSRIPKNGILKIPKLKINDSTELILRNLIAFEQCSMSNPIICHYVILMDMLVDSSKDVELLVKHKIIENDLLGDDHELSSMINRLSKRIVHVTRTTSIMVLFVERWTSSAIRIGPNG